MRSAALAPRLVPRYENGRVFATNSLCGNLTRRRASWRRAPGTRRRSSAASPARRSVGGSPGPACGSRRRFARRPPNSRPDGENCPEAFYGIRPRVCSASRSPPPTRTTNETSRRAATLRLGVRLSLHRSRSTTPAAGSAPSRRARRWPSASPARDSESGARAPLKYGAGDRSGGGCGCRCRSASTPSSTTTAISN